MQYQPYQAAGNSTCPRCSGRGTLPATCSGCGGSGKDWGRYAGERCPRCRGDGREEVRCPSCGGSGRG